MSCPYVQLNTGLETIEAAFEPKFANINVPNIPDFGYLGITPGGWK